VGALRTLADRRGDCTEFAYLATALARAAGIPARVVSGYRYAGLAVLLPNDRHDWAEFYLGGRWRVVDAHDRRFSQDEGRYLAMLRLGAAPADEGQTRAPFEVNSEAIRVTQY